MVGWSGRVGVPQGGVVGWGGVFDPYVWPLRAVFASHNTRLPFLLHSHSLFTPFPSFSSLYLLSIHHFTPPLILRVTLRYSGYSALLGLLGLLICQPPGVYHYLPYSSHLYPSSLPLLAGGWLHFSLLALLIIFHLSFHLLCGSHYFPYSSSCISIYLIFILPQIYSLISFPLPTYSLYSTSLYIFQITYLLHFLNSPLYIPNYFHFPYISRPYPILHYFPYLCPLYSNLYHIKSLLTLIFTTQLIPLLLLIILPLSPFHFLFIIPYSQLQHHPLLLDFIFYITLLTFITIFTIHYSQLLPYYHFHYYPPFIYLILYYQPS